jgi:ppGpp synthetase/RelA/SpoT-type nucleotidyltranferase
MTNAELEKQYETIEPLCDQFGGELTRQLEELLSEKGTSLGFPIQYRVKEFNSVAEKIERTAFKAQHIRELHDLIGVRIILLFQRDVEIVRNLIKENFRVISEDDKQKSLGEGEFGYSSIHFQIGLRETWRQMPTFKKVGEFQAEIQVRTVAQHIWAAASHILQYKNEAGIPPPIRRSIHRVSALLEIVDLEFERVLEKRESYKNQPSANFAETLNVDLLAKILDERLPLKNRRDEDYAILLEDLLAFSITTSSLLRELIAKHLQTALVNDAALLESYRSNPQTASSDNIKRGTAYSHAGLVRNMMNAQFGQEWGEYRKAKYHPQLLKEIEEIKNPK